MHKIVQQMPYYIPLLGIFVVGLVGFLAFPYDRVFQMGLITAIGAAYVMWGIVYHTIHKDLSLGVVLEYTIFGCVGVAAVLTLL